MSKKGTLRKKIEKKIKIETKEEKLDNCSAYLKSI